MSTPRFTLIALALASALSTQAQAQEPAPEHGTIVNTVSLAFKVIVNSASLRCSLPASGLPTCTATIDGLTIKIDPLEHREICVGKACVGCNGADDVGSDKFYLECYACYGNCCCGATCTANDGWHCGNDGCSGC